MRYWERTDEASNTVAADHYLRGRAAAGGLLVRTVRAGGVRQRNPGGQPVLLSTKLVRGPPIPRQLQIHIYRRDSSNVPPDRHDAQHGLSGDPLDTVFGVQQLYRRACGD